MYRGCPGGFRECRYKDGETTGLATEAELEAAIVRTMPRMLTVATRILRDRTDAEDAVQDACLQAFRKLDTYDGSGALEGWLHRIALNAALARLRKRGRLAEGQIDDLMPEYDRYGVLLGDPDWRRINPEALLMMAETSQTVRDAIDQLPDRARILLLLRDIEGLSVAETAAALEISGGAVKTGLHRARLALKTFLTPLFSEDGS